MNVTNCPNCGAQRLPGAVFCDNCGEPLQASVPPEPEGIICPNCGTHAVPGQAFCDHCGTALSQVQPAQDAPTPGIQPAFCPKCGHRPIPGAAFCDNCGTPLKEPELTPESVPAGATLDISPEPSKEKAPQARSAQAGLRLIVQPSKASLPFPANKNEVIIGREDPISSHFPDIELGAYGGDEGGVSRQHARIIIQGDRYLIEDLESVNYTFVNKQKLEPGSRRSLQDSDELRFGRVVAIFRCT